MVVLAKSSPIMPAALHPNPFIQSLQNAGVDWCWPDYSLSCFWRATQEAMGRAGWPSHTTPWAWDDVHAAYVSRLQGPAALAPRSRGTPRLEPCVASWLDFPQDVLNSAAPMDTLVRFYLARVDLHASDGQSAVLWAAVFRFCAAHGWHKQTHVLADWTEQTVNADRWRRTHDVVAPFDLPLWQAGMHMHRLVMDGSTTEVFDINDLVVV